MRVRHSPLVLLETATVPTRTGKRWNALALDP
jgi:hypothetical protein